MSDVYSRINFSCKEINMLLEKIKNGVVLTDKEYDQIFNGNTAPAEPSKPNQPEEVPSFSGDYNDLINKPIIPSKLSELENDMEFLFEEDVVAKLEELRNEINGVLDNKVNKEEINVKADKEQLEDMKNNVTVLLENKIDKLEGHSLVADDEIERLSKVDNYDDAEIRNMFMIDEPYMSYPNTNKKLYVFACGYPMVIEGREDGGVDITYAYNMQPRQFNLTAEEAEKLIVVGGFGENNINGNRNLPTTNIHVKNANIYAVHGGNYFEGNVGEANVLIENSAVREVMGGGDGGSNRVINGRTPVRNIVGKTNVKLHNVTNCLLAYGGGCGQCTVNEAHMIIDGDATNIQYAIASGANGFTKKAKLVVNNGTMAVVQSINRGIMDEFEIFVNGGTIKKFYFGGETEDTTVNGVFKHGRIELNNGTINVFANGTNNGVELKEINGVIRNTVIKQGDISKLIELEDRPSDAVAGDCIFDSILNKPLWFNGTNWVDSSGMIVG